MPDDVERTRKSELEEIERTGTAGEHHDIVDLYTTQNYAEVEMLVEILKENGIHYYVRKMEPSAFPLNVGHLAEHHISVEEERIDQARDLIREAIAEGPVSDDGEFLE